MIDKSEFAAGMAALCGAFGREMGPEIGRVYFAVLSPKLNTPQFQRAVQLALETETFWPSPATLLGKVVASKADEAERELRAVNALVGRYGGVQFVPFDAFNALPATTRAAVLAVGGLREIAGTPEEKWPALLRKFSAAYTQAEAAPVTLPAAPPLDDRVLEISASVAKLLPGSKRA